MKPNEIKNKILERLFETSSHCSICNKRSCPHSSRTLNATLKVDDVLRAINLDEYYFKEGSE
ncbi:MAG: hypothetical protein PVG39_02220 [Desulfobacteraceae bacterium]